MATDREVLKEFLVSLGFQLDEHGLKKFVGATTGASSAVLRIGSALVAAGTAVEAFTLTIGRGLEKLFYTAQRTGETMSNLDAIEKAAQRVGLETGEMTSAMEGFARTLRLQPGLTQLLRGFGIDTEHLDKTHQFLELLERLAKMRQQGPVGEAQAASFGQMFGIGPDQLVQLTNNLPRLRAEFEAQLADQKKAGENLDALGPQMVELWNNVREVERAFTSLARELVTEFAPGLNTTMKNYLIPFLNYLIEINKNGQGLARIVHDIFHPIDALRDLGLAKPAANAPGTAPDQLNELIKKYAAAYGVSPSVLRAIMMQESGGNPHAVSARGAQGLMQLMPGNFAAYGVKDPFDPEQSMRGGAWMMKDLLREFGGDLTKALAAYNWGAGHLEQLLASPQGENWRAYLPDETKKYLDTVLRSSLTTPMALTGTAVSGQIKGVSQTNHTTINVTGTDARATGKAVADQQGRVMGDSVRNLKSAFVMGG